MSRAEHTFAAADTTVTLTVPDGVEVPPWIRLKLAGEVVTFNHSGVRNLRAPAKRKTRQSAAATKIPPDWFPPDEAVAALAIECPSVNLGHELKQFVDYWLGSGRPMVDWLATWRRWVRQTHARNLERGWKPPRVTTPAGETPQARWCREHGITEADYEERKDDREWVEMIKRRGRVQ